MTTFVMGALAVLILAFLVMITVQMIRIERTIVDLVDICDSRVSGMYDEPAA